MPPYVVTRPEAAELLAQPTQLRALKPFMWGPKTVGEVAAAQHLSVEQLHPRVQRFLRAGLLRVAGEVPRRGRASKLYEAVATDFEFPTRLLRPRTLQKLLEGESWLSEFFENLERYGKRQIPATIQVRLEENGALHWLTSDDPPDDAHPAACLIQSGALYLSPAEAEALAAELDTLYRKYENRRGPQRFGLLLGLTPMLRPVD